MDLRLLDENFDVIDGGILDTFESFIWADRYDAYGDFEIFTSPTAKNIRLAKTAKYLEAPISEHMMFVDDILIKTDPENGDTLSFSGNSLEFVLDRRIVWEQTILDGKVQDCIKKLITENAISPKIADRVIPNLVFEESTDPTITSLTMKGQITGGSLYSAISAICTSFKIGFKITVNTETKKWVFKLYAGVDRSYSQETNPHVTFSPKYDNCLSTNYVESTKKYKNVTLVAGEGEGSARRTAVVGSGKGLERRESFTDARDISSTTGDKTLTESEYNEQLTQRGSEALSEFPIIKSFEGEIAMDTSYVYGSDYFMGDIIQIVNEYGIESKSRLVEVVMSLDESGYKTYPTLATV